MHARDGTSGVGRRFEVAGLADKWSRRLVGSLLVVVAVWLIVLGLFNLRHPSDWAMGDWLINYSGGFVRRGLLGEIALLLHGLGVPPLWAVLVLQWGLYALVLTKVWRLLRGMRWPWWVTASVLSPASLAFVLQDPPFAFRKEILLFALLSMVTGSLTAESDPSRSTGAIQLALLLTFGCGLCVLAHEGLLLYFPYLFAAILLRYRSLRRTAQIVILPVLISIGLFVLVSRFPGTQEEAQAVCRSIGGQMTTPPSGICGGAIAYLTRSPAYAHAQVRHDLLTTGLLRLVPGLFLLPFLPAMVGLLAFRRSDPFTYRVVLSSMALSGVLSLSLFYYGTDWTRWIYIHSFSLMLLMLFGEWNRQNVREATSSQEALTGKGYSWLATLCLGVYALGWNLSVYEQRPLYLTFFRFVTRHLLPGQQ